LLSLLIAKETILLLRTTRMFSAGRDQCWWTSRTWRSDPYCSCRSCCLSPLDPKSVRYVQILCGPRTRGNQNHSMVLLQEGESHSEADCDSSY